MKHNIPNILTVSRIVLAFVFLGFYLSNSVQLRLLGIFIFAIAALTDFFDGYFARAYKVSSNFGIFLDPLADKFLTISGFVTLPILFPLTFPWWAIAAILVRDVFITGFRMWAENKGQMIETRYLAKVKTLLQMIFLYVALFFGAFRKLETPIAAFSNQMFTSGILTYSLYAVALITVYSGIEYLFKNKSLFK
ncbi:MAG: CDP-diacylglycerol--glycerol-3-phosphate 3-phosphatidyltransferase [Bacteroidetes bacterium]|nr:CDP-diacylglycerol--glycerol-3-phosphate 3-phosphatidyltransferase [Bacteroidota bacterium]